MMEEKRRVEKRTCDVLELELEMELVFGAAGPGWLAGCLFWLEAPEVRFVFPPPASG